MDKVKKIKKLPWWAFHEPEWREYSPKETGLPVPIWVDVCGWKHKKALSYIRFGTWVDEYNPPLFWDSYVIVIDENPYCPNGFKNLKNKKIYPIVKNWVAKNKKPLKDVGLGIIDTQGFEKIADIKKSN